MGQTRGILLWRSWWAALTAFQILNYPKTPLLNLLIGNMKLQIFLKKQLIYLLLDLLHPEMVLIWSGRSSLWVNNINLNFKAWDGIFYQIFFFWSAILPFLQDQYKKCCVTRFTDYTSIYGCWAQFHYLCTYCSNVVLCITITSQFLVFRDENLPRKWKSLLLLRVHHLRIYHPRVHHLRVCRLRIHHLRVHHLRVHHLWEVRH